MRRLTIFPFFGLALVIIFLIGIFLFANPFSPDAGDIFSFPDSVVGCAPLQRNNSVPSAIFENLPSPPACFDSLVQAYRSSLFTDSFFLSPSYYLQPEFIPGFERELDNYWVTPSRTHFGAVGFGAYTPTPQLTLERGKPYRFRIFFYSGFGVRSFQGVRLAAVLDNPLNEKYVSIDLDDSSESGFLLGPTFPKFDEKWVHPVDVTVFLSPDAPPKSILFHLVTLPPSDDWVARVELPPGSSFFKATDFVGSRRALTMEISPS